jgi:hypothetical protein
MILAVICGVVAWGITAAYQPDHRYKVLFWAGVLLAGVLPAILTFINPCPPGDFSYACVYDERRAAHQAIVSLKKQVLLDPLNQPLLADLTARLRDNQRFLETAQIFILIEKVRPLSDQEHLLAATCLMDASPGIMPPKASMWLASIPPTSALYPQALLLMGR